MRTIIKNTEMMNKCLNIIKKAFVPVSRKLIDKTLNKNNDRDLAVVISDALICLHLEYMINKCYVDHEQTVFFWDFDKMYDGFTPDKVQPELYDIQAGAPAGRVAGSSINAKAAARAKTSVIPPAVVKSENPLDLFGIGSFELPEESEEEATTLPVETSETSVPEQPAEKPEVKPEVHSRSLKHAFKVNLALTVDDRILQFLDYKKEIATRSELEALKKPGESNKTIFMRAGYLCRVGKIRINEARTEFLAINVPAPGNFVDLIMDTTPKKLKQKQASLSLPEPPKDMVLNHLDECKWGIDRDKGFFLSFRGRDLHLSPDELKRMQTFMELLSDLEMSHGSVSPEMSMHLVMEREGEPSLIFKECILRKLSKTIPWHILQQLFRFQEMAEQTAA